MKAQQDIQASLIEANPNLSQNEARLQAEQLITTQVEQAGGSSGGNSDSPHGRNGPHGRKD